MTPDADGGGVSAPPGGPHRRAPRPRGHRARDARRGAGPRVDGAEHVTLIAPPMGARFSMALARLEAGGTAGPPHAGAGRAVYCLEGSLTLTAEGLDHRLSPAGWPTSRPAPSTP